MKSVSKVLSTNLAQGKHSMNHNSTGPLSYFLCISESPFLVHKMRVFTSQGCCEDEME